MRLLRPCHGRGEVEILVQRALHDPCQLGIMEARPPLVQGRCRQRGGTSFDRGGIVKRLQVHCWAMIFRPHGASAEARAESERKAHSSDEFPSGGRALVRQHQAVHSCAPFLRTLRATCFKISFVNTPQPRHLTRRFISSRSRFSPCWLIVVTFFRSITSSRPLSPDPALSQAAFSSSDHGGTSLPSTTSRRCFLPSTIEIFNMLFPLWPSDNRKGNADARAWCA